MLYQEMDLIVRWGLFLGCGAGFGSTTSTTKSGMVAWFGVARTRAGVYFEHSGAEKDKVRCPAPKVRIVNHDREKAPFHPWNGAFCLC